MAIFSRYKLLTSLQLLTLTFLLIWAMQPAVAQGKQELWVIPFHENDKAEMVLAQTMQGLSGAQSPRIWLESGGMSARILSDLAHEGWKLNRIDSVWQLPDSFWHEHPSFITYRAGDNSLDIATTLCGPYNAVAVSEELKEKASAKGLREAFSAIGQDPLSILAKLKKTLSSSIAIEQNPAKASYLRDFAVLNKAYCFYAGKDDQLRIKTVGALAPYMYFFGWGDDEYRWISAFSKYGSQGVAADFCVNLSAFSRLPVVLPAVKAQPQPLPVKNGERIVAFLVSDGDNLQWLTNNMPLDSKFFGNPHRGECKINWGLSPLLVSLAPRVLKYFYDNATPNDAFFAMGNPSYRYMHSEPSSPGQIDARQLQLPLRQSHLNIVTTINTNQGSLAECAHMLALPEVDGVVYLSFSPYNRLNGQILWCGKKPAVAAKYMLWENLANCDVNGVVRSIASMPASPETNTGSFAIVIVHAWSFEKMGGPVEAIRQTVARLPQGTRVVTVDEYFKLLKANFAPGQSKSKKNLK